MRTTEKEHRKLEELSRQTGRSKSDVVRAMLAGYQLKPLPSAELEELNRQLLHIGVNLNQIAQQVNAIGLLDEAWYREQAQALHELRLQLYARFLLPEKMEAE